MKHTTKMCVLIISVVAITGCAPLQQAPLVYSSKQSLGVDFSTATTEQPGLALNLGFKSVDAAYVPVAVAKPCDNKDQGANKTKTDCTSSVYALQQIQGGNNNTDSNSQTDTVENAKKVLTDFSAANGAKKTADAAVNDAVANLEKLKAQLSEMQTNALPLVDKTLREMAEKLKGLPTSPTEDADKAKLMTAQQGVINAKDQKTQLEKLIIDLQSQVTTASADMPKKKEAAAQAQAAFDKVDLSKVADALKTVVTASTIKTDAYSVFGSFGANTSFGTTGSAGAGSNAGTTGNANAGIAIGKIFSTGVASQNLTEGIRGYYERIGIAQMQQARSTYIDCLKATPARLKQIGLPDDMSSATDEQKKKAEAAYNDCSKSGVTINLPQVNAINPAGK